MNKRYVIYIGFPDMYFIPYKGYNSKIVCKIVCKIAQMKYGKTDVIYYIYDRKKKERAIYEK